MELGQLKKAEEFGRYAVEIGMRKKLDPDLVFLTMDIVVRAMSHHRADWFIELYLFKLLDTGFFNQIEVLRELHGIMKKGK